MFWGPQRTQRITGNAFRVSYNLIGKLTMGILTSQSWRVLKSWYTGGNPENEFQRCFAEGLNQKLSSLYGAGYQKDVTFGSLILYHTLKRYAQVRFSVGTNARGFKTTPNKGAAFARVSTDGSTFW